MNDLKYEPALPITRETLTVQLESGSPQTVASAIYSAARHEEDWIWVQNVCLKALTSPEVPVRWAAATCLGDLAFSRRPLDVGAVLPALETAAQDPAVADPAAFSLSMVKQFLIGE